MKAFIFTVFFIALTYSFAFSQVEADFAKKESGGFGALTASLRTINDKPAFYTGGGGGFIVKDLRIGVFFSGLTNTFSQKDTSNVTYKLGCSYGGLWLSYPFYTKKDFHPIIDFKMSLGDMRLINTNWMVRDNSVFFGFSGAIGMEYKVSPIFYVAGGLKYHYNHFLDELEGFSKGDFNSFGVYFSVKLGSFDGILIMD